MKKTATHFCRLLLGSLCMVLIGLTPVHAQVQQLIHYTNENGLPANGVKGIELDKTSGILWVGTDGGIVQFNGKNFSSPLANDKTAYMPRVYALGATVNNKIYVQNENESPKLIDGYGGLHPTTVSRDFIFRHPDTNSKYSSALTDLLKEPNPEITETSSFIYLPQRKACLLIFWSRLECFEKKWKSIPSPGNPCGLFRIGGQIFLWDCDSFNFYKLDTENWHFEKMQVDAGELVNKRIPYTSLFWESGMDNPIILDGTNVYQVLNNGDSIKIQLLSRFPAPPPALIPHIYFVRVWKEKDMIFYGTIDDGLYIGHRPLVTTITPPSNNDSKYASVYSFMQFNNDFLQDASGRTYPLQNNTLHTDKKVIDKFTQAFRAADSSAWLEYNDTIFHFQQSKPPAYFLLHDGEEKRVFAETRGKMYIASSTGIGIVNNGKYQRLFDFPSWSFAKKDMNINDFKEWKPGILAIATHQLYLFNTNNGEFKKMPVTGSDCMLRSLHKSGPYMFITTYGKGIFCERDGIVKQLPFDKMGYLSHAHSIIEDRYGYGWISTNYGLFKVSMQSLKEAYDKNLDEIYYHYFGKQDGLINMEMNGGCQPSGLHLKDGKIAFPTMNGIAVINPEIPCATASLPVRITEIRIDSTLVTGDQIAKQVNWPPGISNLAFSLQIPMWENKENIYISYMLSGYDRDWKYMSADELGVLNFGNITPGTYELVIRTRSGFNTNDFLYTRFSFSVPLPWYRKWWAFLAGGIIIIFLLGIVIWLRTKALKRKAKELTKLVAAQTTELDEKNKTLAVQLDQLNEQNQRLHGDDLVKTRLIAIINHDLVAPIKFVGLIGSELQKRNDEDKEIAKASKSLVTVSDQMEKLAGNILTWININQQSHKMKPQEFNLLHLIQEATAIPAKLAKHKNITFLVSIPEDMVINQYRDALGIIMYNLTINAVKYTGSGSVTVSSSSSESNFGLTVADTGIGIPADTLEKLNAGEPEFSYYSKSAEERYRFGHFIIRDLLTLTSGDMKITSSPGSDTTIVLSFKSL